MYVFLHILTFWPVFWFVCVSVCNCLSVYLSISPHLWLSVRMTFKTVCSSVCSRSSIWLSVYLLCLFNMSDCPAIACPYDCFSVHPSVSQSASLSLSPSISQSVCQSISQSVHQSVSLSVYLSVRPSVSLSVSLTVCLPIWCTSLIFQLPKFRRKNPDGERTLKNMAVLSLQVIGYLSPGLSLKLTHDLSY